MKYAILILSVMLFSCQSKKDLLVNKRWILWNMITTDSTTYYTEDNSKMVFEFKDDGSFYYAENGISKGDVNTYKIDGNKLNLHWSGVYVDKMNELVISDIDTGRLTLTNKNSGDLLPSRFSFCRSGSQILKYVK